MNPPKDCYSKLKKLIDSEKYNELQCKKFLEYVPSILFNKGTLNKILFKKAECPLYSGISDFVISGNIIDEDGTNCSRAYVWELKAPQCPIFKKDKKNRLKPSDHLISAENQLLNYYYEIKNNPAITRDFGVNPNDVYIGGIIIGNKRTLVAGNNDKELDIMPLYQRAKSIREYFYKAEGIRLMTWDNVLNRLGLELNTKKFTNKKISAEKITLTLKNITLENIEIDQEI